MATARRLSSEEPRLSRSETGPACPRPPPRALGASPPGPATAATAPRAPATARRQQHQPRPRWFSVARRIVSAWAGTGVARTLATGLAQHNELERLVLGLGQNCLGRGPSPWLTPTRLQRIPAASHPPFLAILQRRTHPCTRIRSQRLFLSCFCKLHPAGDVMPNQAHPSLHPDGLDSRDVLQGLGFTRRLP